MANARLRQVVEAKDAEIAALKAGFAAELARLEVWVAELERRLGQWGVEPIRELVHWGQITNRHRDWHKGNHPGYNLARRLAIKADQVWLFTEVFAVPWTNNASEQALKTPKLHQKVSGYWHTTTTLARFCRVRSYLISARNHGLGAIDAIHAALTGKPWLPVPATA